MTIRCPFCEFDRSHPPRDDPDWRAVQSMREVAVHIVFAHYGLFDELAQTVGGEWVRPSQKPEALR